MATVAPLGSSARRLQPKDMHDATFGKFKEAAGIRRRNLSIDEFLTFEPESGTVAHWRWQLANLAESTISRSIFISFVLLNGVLIGVEADHPDDDFWDPVEYGFVLIFIFEISVKLIGFGSIFWTDWWNVMDFLIVAASVFDIVLKWVSGEGSAAGLSVLRLMRVLRVIRVIGFLEKLNLLVHAFVEALKCVAWVMILVLIVIYIFAVLGQGFFGNMVSDPSKGEPPCPNNDPDCIEHWFGTVMYSMLTLLQIMTMDSWGGISSTTGSQYPAARVFFVAFVSLAGLGMMNLLTAVFVEALLLQTAKHEGNVRFKKEANRKEALALVAQAFTTFDEDGNGVLDQAELTKVNESLDTAEARTTFEMLGLPADEIIRATTHAVENDPDGLGVMGYQAMLERIDKMHDAPEKEDVWEVENKVKRLEKTSDLLVTQVHQLKTDMGSMQSDVQKVLRLLRATRSPKRTLNPIVRNKT